MRGEFDFIEGIRQMFSVPGALQLPEGVMGIGDDCAIIPQQSGWETLVSTDMLVEGSHFLMDDITAYQLGWKAAASNFSDIAAMGGAPVGSFLALALPHDLPGGWEEEFLKGYRDISEEYGFPLLGGDTTSSRDRVCICVTVLGKTPSGLSVRRSGAKDGDLVCVTGFLGDSAAGLSAILHGYERDEDVRYLIDKHYLPHPRVREGQVLAAWPGVHSMMDISDGIGSDLHHIMEQSQVGARVGLSEIPLSQQLRSFCSRHNLDPYEFAAAGGEDYELLFTIDPEAEADLDLPHTVIGMITDGPELEWDGSEKDYMGFRHF